MYDLSEEESHNIFGQVKLQKSKLITVFMGGL